MFEEREERLNDLPEPRRSMVEQTADILLAAPFAEKVETVGAFLRESGEKGMGRST
jgi:hypothetical protein